MSRRYYIIKPDPFVSPSMQIIGQILYDTSNEIHAMKKDINKKILKDTKTNIDYDPALTPTLASIPKPIPEHTPEHTSEPTYEPTPEPTPTPISKPTHEPTPGHTPEPIPVFEKNKYFFEIKDTNTSITYDKNNFKFNLNIPRINLTYFKETLQMKTILSDTIQLNTNMSDYNNIMISALENVENSATLLLTNYNTKFSNQFKDSYLIVKRPATYDDSNIKYYNYFEQLINKIVSGKEPLRIVIPKTANTILTKERYRKFIQSLFKDGSIYKLINDAIQELHLIDQETSSDKTFRDLNKDNKLEAQLIVAYIQLLKTMIMQAFNINKNDQSFRFTYFILQLTELSMIESNKSNPIITKKLSNGVELKNDDIDKILDEIKKLIYKQLTGGRYKKYRYKLIKN